MKETETHQAVSTFLNGLKVQEVKECSEFPNKYGDNVSEFKVIFDFTDQYNYDSQTFKIDHSRSVLFIPNQGYLPFKTLDGLITIIKSHKRF